MMPGKPKKKSGSLWTEEAKEEHREIIKEMWAVRRRGKETHEINSPEWRIWKNYFNQKFRGQIQQLTKHSEQLFYLIILTYYTVIYSITLLRLILSEHNRHEAGSNHITVSTETLTEINKSR